MNYHLIGEKIMAIGFLILIIASFFQGTFALAYKNYSPFSWAAFFAVVNSLYAVTCVVFTWVFAPELWTIIGNQPGEYWVVPILCGALWGLSAVGFSKGIDKVGMSLVYGISMGISTIVGSIVPMIMENKFPEGISALLFWIGLVLTLAGVLLITIAGVKRDGFAKNATAGIILAVLSGLGSGAMNVGFAYSESIGEEFIKYGYSQAAISGGKWLPVLFGGCIMCVIWCMGEMTVKKEWHTLVAKGSLRRIPLFCVVSVMWYLALLLYGLSTIKLGAMGNTVGWILFNALALIISVGWGLLTGEWKNAKKKGLFVGCAVLIIAWVFTALV